GVARYLLYPLSRHSFTLSQLVKCVSVIALVTAFFTSQSALAHQMTAHQERAFSQALDGKYSSGLLFAIVLLVAMSLTAYTIVEVKCHTWNSLSRRLQKTRQQIDEPERSRADSTAKTRSSCRIGSTPG
ncbi:MAG: hypothetical protein AAGG44_19715, partial [Planctomycetota bacterium]